MSTLSMGEIPFVVKNAFKEAAQYFPTPIQQFQFYDKYARFDYEKGRRETWIETVDRATNYLKELSNSQLADKEYEEIRSYILGMKATPSMRLLAMAGPAARRDNAAIYNCSYLPLDSIESLVEELYIAMAGTGVGYSVENKYVDKFPIVSVQKKEDIPVWKWANGSPWIIQDSTEGWAEAFKHGLDWWFAGYDPTFDYSKIRPAGTPLKVKGGRASGPEPLKNLLEFTRDKILSRQGKKMRPIDVHDVACKIGEAIVSGGVRRTALIALFDADDQDMLNCKNGENLVGNEQRWMSNNSAVWTEEVKQDQLLEQMYEMMRGMRGEPGIFSRYNANLIKPERRKPAEFGTNPCGEINLRPYEFCNLSIAIARPNDTLTSLKEKVRVATLIGTIQSMATHFPYLRDIWKKNCEEERLLGVDINGWVDCPLLHPKNPELDQNLRELREVAIETNKSYAQRLGINQSVSVTCVKPSGNSSQLFNCASGIHPRHYKHYIRNVRVQAQSPLRELLQSQGVPMDPENNQTADNATAYVVHFPIKAPEDTILRDEMSAIDQCEYWLAAKLNWTEHNPSVTISYKQSEVIDLISWVWNHRQQVGGLSFLPSFDAQYEQMPYQHITEEEYEKLTASFPEIHFEDLFLLEKEDFTTSSQELACVSGACSIEEYQALQNERSMMGLT